ncbi:hypothetical protein J6590_027653 [Homalodisca vitripennis]|nr:hypothetical protein J6590_027653 [Homalodisca vitripennis]
MLIVSILWRVYGNITTEWLLAAVTCEFVHCRVTHIGADDSSIAMPYSVSDPHEYGMATSSDRMGIASSQHSHSCFLVGHRVSYANAGPPRK